jgi:exodeoxyribonuclease VII, small subunit
MMNAQNEPMTFEQALTRLEAIVRTLEAGELPLDETVRLYEEGQRLRLYCEQYLADAEQRIAVIRQASDGGIIVEQSSDDLDDAELDEVILFDDEDDPFR